MREKNYFFFFLDQHSSGTVSYRMKKFSVLSETDIPSGELAIRQANKNHSPFLCEAKHQKLHRSQDTCSIPSLSQLEYSDF